VLLHLLKIDPGTKALALAAKEQAAHLRLRADAADDIGELVPRLAVEGVDGRMIKHHLADVILYVCANSHDPSGRVCA
jgi:hypothetical protein